MRWRAEDHQEGQRLRWFRHVRRREEHTLRRALNFEVEGRRPPGRPKTKWRVVVEDDMRILNNNKCTLNMMIMTMSLWRV